jgi:hypothetical protein
MPEAIRNKRCQGIVAFSIDDMYSFSFALPTNIFGFVVCSLWFDQQVTLICQFLDSDNAAFSGRGVSVDFDWLTQRFGHVVDGVFTGKKAHTASDQAINAFTIAIVFKQEPQSGSECHDFDVNLILAVGFQNVAGNIQDQRLFGWVHIADLKNELLFDERSLFLSQQ